MKIHAWIPVFAAVLLVGGTTGARAQAQPALHQGKNDASAAKQPARYVVPAGTRLPLILQNAVSTRNAHPGDPVYLETVYPIVLHERILIPAGSYVQGEILEAKRPGRVKGRGEIRIRLNSMVLPDGYQVDFNAVPANAEGGGNESTDREGKIKGDTDKAADVGTVVKTTGVGAGIGAIAARSAKGAGIGAGVGAAVGLATVLFSRGPELELPRGSTLEAVLNRPLYLDASRIHFTDSGRSSALPGPPNREPVRSRSPF